MASCSSSDDSSSPSESSSSPSSEGTSEEPSQETSEEASQESTQETSEQGSNDANKESPEERETARASLIDIIASSLPFENEAFVICFVDTARENFGGPYQRLLDGITSDAETPKLDQAADEALQTCQSELTADEFQLLTGLEDDAEEGDAEEGDAEEVTEEELDDCEIPQPPEDWNEEEDGEFEIPADSCYDWPEEEVGEEGSPPDDSGVETEEPSSGADTGNDESSGVPPPTVGNCYTTIGVDYELFYDFSQPPDVVMVGYGEVLNLYDEPDVSSSVILTIPAMEEVIAYEGYSRQIASNSWPYTIWHCMTYNGFHGWVPDFYVSMIADSSPTSGYGLIGLVRSDLEGFEEDVQTIFGGFCPEYAGVGTQIVLSDLQTRAIGGDVTFDIRGVCDDASSGMRLTLTAQRLPSRQGSLEVTSAEIRPFCMRGVSGQLCS